MTIRLIKNDYCEEGDYPALENLSPATSKGSAWVDLKAGFIEWVKDDWKYACFLAALVVVVWLFGPWGR